MHPAFALDPDVTFLNHGSFGACPRDVLAYQAELRARLEAEPVRFFLRDYEGLLDEARAAVAAFVGAASEDLVSVPTATTGVASVLGSLRFDAGDEILVTNHGYNACRNACEHTASRWGARVVVATVSFPVASPDDVVDAVLASVTERTRLALLDHITSPTGVVFPIERLAAALEARGVEVLVDAAHSAGQVPIAVGAWGASYTTGNLHKWSCAPKGAAFLHVRRDRRDKVRPSVISHGANAKRADRSRFHLEFDWTGTDDPTAWLAVPRALDVMAREFGGWDAIRAANHALALSARDIVTRALDVAPPAPPEMLGAMVAVLLPSTGRAPAVDPIGPFDPLQDRLWFEHKIEIPVFPFEGRRIVRLSAQRYNTIADYEKLARALVACRS